MLYSNSKDFFYILVEGEPDSPEVSFLNNMIGKIFDHNDDISLTPKVIEVGGSSSFKSFAKFCYRDSEIHANIPVLALSDSDYRTSLDKKQKQNNPLIKNKNPKIVYWKRHEWENYLLDETTLIADLINELPSKAKDKKPYKQNSETVSKEEIDTALLHYFQKQVKNEFWECLKFNLSRKVKKYPSVKKPDNFDGKTLDEVEKWFLNKSKETTCIFELHDIYPELFQTILKEFNWEALINSPSMLIFEDAKTYFRGKEAFDCLYQFIQGQVKFQNLSKEDLKIQILQSIRNMNYKNSFIYRDLEDLLLPELKGDHSR
jgi:hypothetical protein